VFSCTLTVSYLKTIFGDLTRLTYVNPDRVVVLMAL
jgi:hypothetical protein